MTNRNGEAIRNMYSSIKHQKDSLSLLDAYCAPARRPVRVGMANPYPASCKPLSDEWRETTKDSRLQWWVSTNRHFRTEAHPGFDMRTYDFRDALVAFGGEEVCMPFGSEREVDELLSRGQLWGATSRVEVGEISRCHSNSAQLWSSKQGEYFIATGYALSADGLWRSHTWCIEVTEDGPSIIETTVERLLYFGYVLTLDECANFAKSNWNGDVLVSHAAVALHDAIQQGKSA